MSENIIEDYEGPSRSHLQTEWNAMTDGEREVEIQDYQFQVVSSHHDAFDHRYHAIFAGW